MGGGVGLAAAADLVLATPQATFHRWSSPSSPAASVQRAHGGSR
jgi:hypothetical protein